MNEFLSNVSCPNTFKLNHLKGKKFKQISLVRMIVMVEMIINNRNDNNNNSIYNICNGNIHSNKSS